MKHSVYFSLLPWLIISGYVHGQQIIYKDPVFLKRCAGDELIVWNHQNVNNKVKTTIHDDCSYVTEYNVPNWEELTISGGDLIRREEDVDAPGNSTYQNGFLTLVFKATQSTTITIRMTQRNEVNYEGRHCNGFGESNSITYVYTYMLSVPPKDAPTLTSSKPGVKPDESFSLTVERCDQLYWGVQVSANSSSCQSERPSDLYSPAYDRNIISEPQKLSRTTTFYVRCSDNNCFSEWSNGVKVDLLPTSNPCNDPTLDYINSFEKNPSADYHYYPVENVVCLKSGNPNCTVENAFAFLRSKKIYNAPIAVDFPETIPSAIPGMGGDWGNWETKVPLLGSDLLYKVDLSPVNNCDKLSLPSAFGVAANFAAFALSAQAGMPAPYLLVKELTPVSGATANPIKQIIDPSSNSITNYTLPGHILYPGRIIRRIVEDCNSIKIVTFGTGQSWAGDNPLGAYMKGLNERAGTILFNNVDQRFITDFNK